MRRAEGQKQNASPHEPSDWPPEGAYQEITDGWLLSKESSEWLYKPSSGVYFHSPSETLWRKARDGQRRFIRLNDLGYEGRQHTLRSRGDYERLVVATLGFAAASPPTLLRACFCSWSHLAHQFEEMQRDLRLCCEAARSVAGTIARPRTSKPQLSTCTAPPLSSEDHGDLFGNADEGLLAGLARMLGAPFTWRTPPQKETAAENCGGKNSHCSSLTPTGARTLEAPLVLPFTSLSVARHNVHPLQRSHTAPSVRLLRSGTSNTLSGHGLSGQREPPRHELLPDVHVEREAGWRRHANQKATWSWPMSAEGDEAADAQLTPRKTAST